MPPRRSARPVPSPLTDEQVAQLRADVRAGRSPRVVIRTPSAGLPAGTRGPVLRVGDPAAESEFIVVGLGGDEIPFAPAELALPGAAGRRTPDKQAGPPAAPAVLPAEPSGSVPPSPPAPPPATARPRTRAGKPPLRTAAPTPATKAPALSRAARRKPPGPVSLTLRFADGRWTAEAARGGKRVGGKAVPVRAGAVAALAELIDDEHVSGLIAETVEACRSEVEERAAHLRAQLAEAEQALREYER